VPVSNWDSRQVVAPGENCDGNSENRRLNRNPIIRSRGGPSQLPVAWLCRAEKLN
jgi:hypothetical protein